LYTIRSQAGSFGSSVVRAATVGCGSYVQRPGIEASKVVGVAGIAQTDFDVLRMRKVNRIAVAWKARERGR